MKPSSFQHLFTAALSICLVSLSQFAFAIEGEALPDAKEGVVTLKKEINPPRDVGYIVGDVLERTIVLEIKKPYKLLDTSLPIVGYERRWKNQPTGIELVRIKHDKAEHDAATTHTLHLAYQVFTNNVVAKPAVLPGEIVKLQADKEIVQYRIPSWQFAISPISVYGSVKIETDMSPLRGPLLLNADAEKQRLKILLTILALALLGLLYILGRHAWLPRMGGPFAKAYRKVSKLRRGPASDASLQTAVSHIHEALNTTAGNSVFSDTLDAFLAKKPAFKPIKGELLQFFGLSRHVFFEHHAVHETGPEPMEWLRAFCRRCRDCERGLTPDSQQSTV